MKIKLFFDSRNEFSEFILSASSIRFRNEFSEVREHKNPYDIDFLTLVSEIEIGDGDVHYSVTKAANNTGGIVIENYMLNKEQISWDSISYMLEDGSTVKGSEKVKDFLLQQLPSIFGLRVGWVTDYEEFVFKKQ